MQHDHVNVDIGKMLALQKIICQIRADVVRNIETARKRLNFGHDFTAVDYTNFVGMIFDVLIDAIVSEISPFSVVGSLKIDEPLFDLFEPILHYTRMRRHFDKREID